MNSITAIRTRALLAGVVVRVAVSVMVFSSPFRDGAVIVPPQGVSPSVPLGGAFDDVLFVDLDAEARTRRDVHVPVAVVEHRGIDEVVEQIVGGVVLDSEALLLDDGVVASGVDLQARCQRDRSQRAVWSQR